MWLLYKHFDVCARAPYTLMFWPQCVATLNLWNNHAIIYQTISPPIYQNLYICRHTHTHTRIHNDRENDPNLKKKETPTIKCSNQRKPFELILFVHHLSDSHISAQPLLLSNMFKNKLIRLDSSGKCVTSFNYNRFIPTNWNVICCCCCCYYCTLLMPFSHTLNTLLVFQILFHLNACSWSYFTDSLF